MTSSQRASAVYLWVAVLIFAASNAVTRKVTDIGAQHLIDGRNPISLCNVLFAGNLCALAVMVLVFGRDWHRLGLQRLTRRDWLSLGAIALLSGALGPALIFAALDTTNVTNVVLIGRLEPPLALAFSVLLLKARVNIWTVLGSGVSFLGGVATALFASTHSTVPMMGGLIHLGLGELYAAIAALILAIAAVISQWRLQHISLGVFNLVRVSVGTAVFFVLANGLYGPEHFVDLASPVLWKWMLLYGAVIVVAGQLCWFAGLRHSTPAQSNLASSVSPIAAIAMAYLILGETPTTAQYWGGLIIFGGIILSLVGSWHEAKSNRPLTPAQQMKMAIGFKGI